MEPFRSDGLIPFLDKKDVEALCGLLRQTTPDESAREYCCQIRYTDGMRPARIICRAVWSEEEIPQFLGAVGKIEEDRR